MPAPVRRDNLHFRYLVGAAFYGFLGRAFPARLVPIFADTEAVFSDMAAEIFLKFPVGFSNLVILVLDKDKAGNLVEQLLVVLLGYSKPTLVTVFVETNMPMEVTSLQGSVDIQVKGGGSGWQDHEIRSPALKRLHSSIQIFFVHGCNDLDLDMLFGYGCDFFQAASDMGMDKDKGDIRESLHIAGDWLLNLILVHGNEAGLTVEPGLFYVRYGIFIKIYYLDFHGSLLPHRN
jgi:hypothetical protein